jgi:hypothetical protein
MERFEIRILPFPDRAMPEDPPDRPVRTVIVTATGRRGASGFPQFAGEGVEAEIDPSSGEVRAVVVDGTELAPGHTAQATPIRGRRARDDTGGMQCRRRRSGTRGSATT